MRQEFVYIATNNTILLARPDLQKSNVSLG